jgi:hypothetical protein
MFTVGRRAVAADFKPAVPVILLSTKRAAGMWTGSAGFGSSDCPACPSHLLLCPDGLDITAALRHAHNAR